MNQYTQRTVPDFAEVQGRASTDATVTVNLQPTLRQGTYWRSELAVDNGVSPVLLALTNVAVLRGAGAGGDDDDGGLNCGAFGEGSRGYLNHLLYRRRKLSRE